MEILELKNTITKIKKTKTSEGEFNSRLEATKEKLPDRDKEARKILFKTILLDLY